LLERSAEPVPEPRTEPLRIPDEADGRAPLPESPLACEAQGGVASPRAAVGPPGVHACGLSCNVVSATLVGGVAVGASLAA
jgi:hypothetical protein